MLRSLLIIGSVFGAIYHLERKTMAALDDLTREVSEARSVMASASALITGLKAKLDEAIERLEQGDNGAALQALSADLDSASNDLAAAVQAHTPAENGGEGGEGSGDGTGTGEAPAPAPGTPSDDVLITPTGARVPRR